MYACFTLNYTESMKQCCITLLDPSKTNLLLISNLAALTVAIYINLIIKSIRNWVFMIRMIKDF